MTRMGPLLYILLAGGAMPAVTQSSGAQPMSLSDISPKRPNIIWIMADDLGTGEVGIFPGGSEHGRLSTPNLDKLGRSGIQFTQAYAGYTVCAPSRTTLMTGYLSGHFPAKQLSGTALDPSWHGTVLPQMLKSAGYATAGIGKMAPLTNPVASGFDFFIGQVDQSLCHNMYVCASMYVYISVQYEFMCRYACMHVCTQ